MKIVLMGRPGAGKGTQVERVAAALGLEVLSSSSLLREQALQGTPAASQVAEAMRAGDLVPDDVVVDVVVDGIRRSSGSVLLDGFPRTVRQCEAVHRLLDDPIDLAVELTVSPAQVLSRVRSRRVCAPCGIPVRESRCPRCGATPAVRADDEVEIVLRRLWSYERDTRPVLEWFERRNRLTTVDGSGPVELVAERLLDALSSAPQVSAGA